MRSAPAMPSVWDTRRTFTWSVAPPRRLSAATLGAERSACAIDVHAGLPPPEDVPQSRVESYSWCSDHPLEGLPPEGLGGQHFRIQAGSHEEVPAAQRALPQVRHCARLLNCLAGEVRPHLSEECQSVGNAVAVVAEDHQGGGVVLSQHVWAVVGAAEACPTLAVLYQRGTEARHVVE